MKKCPVCNRTYSDETLSFCLEDGSLLSAPFNPRGEQETAILPNKAELPPTQYFSPPEPEYTEIQTVVSDKNEFSSHQQSPEDKGWALQALARSTGKTYKKFSFRIPFGVMLVSVLAALYADSFAPLAIGLFIAVNCLWLFPIKRNKE